MSLPLSFSERSSRSTEILRHSAFLTFAFYLVLLLGFSSEAQADGPLTWLTFWRLPTADSGWAGIGIVSLLPPLSVLAWLLTRARTQSLKTLTWGWSALAWPLTALAGLGLITTLLPCFGGSCDLTPLLRLLLLLAHLAWVYLYIVNERPPLFWIVVSIILIQSIVGIGQFIWQRDLGLYYLGEMPLDPEAKGISVVMRGSERWLRAYGLANHPNSLAGTLTPLLLMLPVLGQQVSPRRQLVSKLAFVIGFAALLTTLARWAIACFALGVSIHILAWLLQSLKRRRWTSLPSGLAAPIALVLVTVGFLAVYGDAVVGRVAELDTPIESRSLWERERDTDISLQLIADHPLNGVGVGNYVAAAREYDPWAEPVHNMPLLLGAEVGLGGLIVWLWLLFAPLMRRGALAYYAPQTALWLSFWLLGVLYNGPHPLYELRSTLLVGLVAGLIASSAAPAPQGTVAGPSTLM
jgi:hypothetical protein